MSFESSIHTLREVQHPCAQHSALNLNDLVGGQSSKLSPLDFTQQNSTANDLLPPASNFNDLLKQITDDAKLGAVSPMKLVSDGVSIASQGVQRLMQDLNADPQALKNDMGRVEIGLAIAMLGEELSQLDGNQGQGNPMPQGPCDSVCHPGVPGDPVPNTGARGGDSVPSPGVPGDSVPSPAVPGDAVPNPAAPGDPVTGGVTGGGGGDGPPVPGGIDLPTPAKASDVAAALANGAGPNNNPHVVTVHNDGELQSALANAQPGDDIQLQSGTYQPFSISNSGREGAPITVEAGQGQHAKIDTGSNYAGVDIRANYVAIKGLEITDSSYNINSDRTPGDYGNGITVQDGNNGSPHNVTLQNNYVHNLPGGGIGVVHGDNITIIGNHVEYTSRLNFYGKSGISLFESVDSTGTAGSTAMYILNNQVNNNEQLVPSTAIGANTITDGNGIILDSFGAYDKGTLVEGNNATSNGRGIHAFNSSLVDITGNTATDNNVTPIDVMNGGSIDNIDYQPGLNDTASNNTSNGGVITY